MAKQRQSADEMLSAAFDKKLDVVKAALTAGVDVNAQEKDWKRTAMHYAAMMDQPQLFALLVKHGGRVDLADKQHTLPLHMAAQHGSNALLQKLLKLAPETINTKAFCGLTALHLAVDHKQDACIETLLKAGADRTIKDAFGRVPADYATKARLKAMLGGDDLPAKPGPGKAARKKDPKPPSPKRLTGLVAPLTSIEAWTKASAAKRKALAAGLCKTLGADWSVSKPAGRHDLITLLHMPTRLRFIVVPGGSTILGLRESDLKILPELDFADEIEQELRDAVKPRPASIGPMLFAETPILERDRVAMYGKKQLAAAVQSAVEWKLRPPTHSEWEWVARSLGVDVFIGAARMNDVEAACDDLSDLTFDAKTRRRASKGLGIWGLQIGEWVSDKSGATPKLGTADIAQTYPWQNEHEPAAAFAGLSPSEPADKLALRLVRSLPTNLSS